MFFWLAVAFLFQPIGAKSADLQDAFKAAVGTAPPVTRQTQLPNWGETTLNLEPLLLVHMSGPHYALIISESFNGAHAAEGDVAVAYLDRNAQGWRPIRVWYEFARTGSFGTPFTGQKLWSFHFQATPIFAGESEYCGMGACTRWYDLIGLTGDGPMDWGSIPASGSLQPIYTFPDGKADNGFVLTGCGGYEYSSKIGAPDDKADLMRLTYIGWMMPGGAGQKRQYFKTSSELFLSRGKPDLRPAVPLPNCGD